MARRPAPAPQRSLVIRLAGLVLAGLCLVLVTVGPAAAVDGSVVYVDRTASGIALTLEIPADVTPDLADATVTVNGTGYPATAASLADGTPAIARTMVLAIDVSDSMEGDRFQAAQSAASTFLDTVPDDVSVGIVTFANQVSVELDPTTDRDAARAVVAGLTLARGTHLYDGVIEAIDLATAGTGQASVLVLSDGADTSNTPIDAAVTAVNDAGVLVDVVALEQDAPSLDVLRQLTGGTGEVIAATSEALTQRFSDEAADLARQVAIAADVPADALRQQLDIDITLGSNAGDVTASTTLLAARVAAPSSDSSLGEIPTTGGTTSIDSPDWFIYAGVAVFGVGLLLVLVLLVPRKPAPMSVEDRVTTYTTAKHGLPGEPEKQTSEPALAQATQAMAEVLKRNTTLEARISERLEAAGSELKSSEWLLLHGAIFVGVAVLGLAVGRGNLFIGLIFMVLGAIGPWIYLGLRRSRRRKKFDALLPDTLQLMSGSLSAGLSLLQSVDTIVREGTDPVKSEFKRVLVETRLGVPLEEALDGVAARFDSRDFRWVVMAIRIQRQVGGNLAELLNTVAATMREREYVRRQVAALAAEGKLSAFVLGGLPPAFLLYLTATQFDYVKPLFTDIRGIIMLVGAALWLGVGAFWMSKLVKVEV